MGNRFRYDAFISYRHCQPDSDIAQQLQKKLENFRLPKALTEKIGKKRPLRIFRDETELSVADNLSDAITTAIWESKYLICICSPAYLESVWCMKEIEAFLRVNDRKHILLVLADGEPETAFPEVLLYEEIFQLGPDGHPQKFRQYKEPLAADCRGDSPKERKTKTDDAVIRLVSGIMGISYEELSQRHRKEAYNRARNRVLAAFGMLLTIIAVCVFFIIRISNQKAQIKRQQDALKEQNDEIEEQKNTIQQKYADSLAQTSAVLLRDGNRKAAAYAARLGFSDENSACFSELAMQALVESLGIYDPPGAFSCDDYIYLPASIYSFAVSPFGGYAMVNGWDNRTYVIDMRSGEMLFDSVASSYSFAFDGDDGFVFQRDGESFRYYDLKTRIETDLLVNEAKATYNQIGNGYALISSDRIEFFRGNVFVSSFDPKSEISSDLDRFDMYAFFTADDNVVFIQINDYPSTYIFKVDVTTGNSEKIPFPDDLIYGFYTDGNIMVWTRVDGSGNYLCLKDVCSDEDPKAIRVNSSLTSVYVNGGDVVACDDNTLWLYDLDLNLLANYPRKDYIGRALVKNDEILLFDDGGYHRISNGEYSYVEPETSENADWYVEDYCDGKLFIAYVGDNHIYSYQKRESRLIQTYSGLYEEVDYASYNASPENKNFLEHVLQKEKDSFADRVRGSVLCQNADLGLVYLYDGTVYIYERSTGERVKSIYGLVGYISSFCYDEKYGCYYISADDLVVYDSEFRNIYRIENVYLAGFDVETKLPVVQTHEADFNDSVSQYIFHPVSCDEVLSMADEYLEGYEPDEIVKEKYGLE